MKHSNRLFIFLAGSHCSGKSTLAQELNKRYNVPVVDGVIKALKQDPDWITHQRNVVDAVNNSIREKLNVGERIIVFTRSPFDPVAYSKALVPEDHYYLHNFYATSLMNQVLDVCDVVVGLCQFKEVPLVRDFGVSREVITDNLFSLWDDYMKYLAPTQVRRFCMSLLVGSVNHRIAQLEELTKKRGFDLR